MDVVRIHGLELDCIVGLRPEERVQPQRLRVDVAMGIDTREAGRTGRISATLDYDRVATDVVALLEFRRYRLMEVAAEELSLMLLSAYPPALWVELRLEKPGALAGRAQAASVEVRRSRGDLETPEPGPHATVLRTRDAELWVHQLEHGESLPDVVTDARVIARVVSGQLHAEDGSVWAAGLSCPNPAQRWGAVGAPARVFRCVVRGGAESG